MMSDFREGWGADMTPKNWTLEGKDQRDKGSKIVRHH